MEEESAFGGVPRLPHPRLRPFVTQYQGYRFDGLDPGVHAGLPGRTMTMIIAFDEPLDVATAADDSDRDVYWAMLAGLHRTPALVRHPGRQHGLQLNLTPRGAAALFGVPARDLATTVNHLDDIVPAFAGELIDRLSATESWRTRFAVLDEMLLRVLRLDRQLPAELERAWGLLCATNGNTAIDLVAAEVGWSRRHLTSRFKATFGLTPKVMAQILRFERAQQLLQLPTRPSLSSVAVACGYADQAHMTREWNVFAGASPTVWMTDQLLPFAQDDADGETTD